jgi:hypothetical protein
MVFMNERLNNLVGQAKVMAEETLNKQISKNAELNAFAEKFAELIVRECVDCINNTDKDGIFTAQAAGIVGAAHQRSIQTIKDHFGVEE